MINAIIGLLQGLVLLGHGGLGTWPHALPSPQVIIQILGRNSGVPTTPPA